MITVRQAIMPDDRDPVRELFAEYLPWACLRIYEEYRAVFDAESILVHDMETLSIFMPPQGYLFLAFEEGAVAGCACVRQLGDGIAELKRMYVRPTFRRKGIGRLLVAETIGTARRLGYALLRLDSAGFMTEAHVLYRAFGFRDTPPYDGSEIPPEYRHNWVFMELDLYE
jgi:GNAT superfamily N-acetyltransferase